MKLPRTVCIYGKTRKVVRNPKSGGGWFDEEVIEIGTKYKARIPEIFIHEVIELVLAESCLRYATANNPTENGDYIFVCNHKEFTNLVPQIALALKDVLKE